MIMVIGFSGYAAAARQEQREQNPAQETFHRHLLGAYHLTHENNQGIRIYSS